MPGLETNVLRMLKRGPASGGSLIERMQADGEAAIRGKAVLVYAALANLARRKQITVVDESPAEVIWTAGAPGRVLARDAALRTFSLGAQDLERLDRVVRGMTRGLPLHYFEEIRRVIAADADRRSLAKLPGTLALDQALSEFGPPGAVRSVLRKVERGGPVPMRLPGNRRRLIAPLVAVGLLLLIKFFLLDIYTVPESSRSMAPTLIPHADGGDGLVLVDLVSRRLGPPQRGDVLTFRLPSGDRTYVKRVWGLAGETVRCLDGDLLIDGETLVKERGLLDRVAVPVCGPEGFERAGTTWTLREPVRTGFRYPDGTWSDPSGPCRDAILRLLVRATPGKASLSIVLNESDRMRCTVALTDSGYDAGASVGGSEVGRGLDFRLPTGGIAEIWLTNADGVFRVQIDHEEILRAPLGRRGSATTIQISTGDSDSVVLESVEVARDLVHLPLREDPAATWKVEPGHYFMLGDNSADSRDSRHFGAIPAGSIRGTLRAVLWPLTRCRWVR